MASDLSNRKPFIPMCYGIPTVRWPLASAVPLVLLVHSSNLRNKVPPITTLRLLLSWSQRAHWSPAPDTRQCPQGKSVARLLQIRLLPESQGGRRCAMQVRRNPVFTNIVLVFDRLTPDRIFSAASPARSSTRHMPLVGAEARSRSYLIVSYFGR